MKFLRQVAEGYYKKYGKELERFRFVFPNKRSGSYFIHYLSRSLPQKSAMVAPDYGTFQDFVEDIMYEYPKENNINTLMMLYNSYRKVMADRGMKAEEIKSFEEFWPWGEVALADFRDIDRNLADAPAIFKNVKDLKELETDYLEDEQREALQDYFGITIPKSKVQNFWLTFNDKKKITSHTPDHIDIKDKFAQLWSLLNELYTDFHRQLREQRLTYDGGVFRDAFARLEEHGLPDHIEKVVFVGFDMLTRSEWEIMGLLKDLGKGEFVWDFHGPAQITSNPELRFMKRNMEIFPMPEWLRIASDAHWPSVKVVASPSNAVQAKIVGKELENIRNRKDVTAKDLEGGRIAVVVPDESLLLPLLYSMPEKMPVNLSLGYPLSQTGTIALVQGLRRLQSRKSREGDAWAFFHEDVKGILSQPMVAMMLGSDTVNAVMTYISRQRRYRLKREELPADELLTLIFRGFGKEATHEDYSAYVRAILSKVMESLTSLPEAQVSDQLEVDHINKYLDALTILEDSLNHYGIVTDFSTMAILADKMIGMERVTFEGERGKGVQMLGVLEARNLDFDFMVMPSMVEKVFPRKFAQRSFIPEALRGEYGLPGARAKEMVFTYYFYRLLTSVKHACFIYDSRTGGMKSGDMSRYLLQLKHIYAPDTATDLKIEWYNCQFDVAAQEASPLSVKKDEILPDLLSLCQPGGITLSASDFSKYILCPLKLYYYKLKHIADDNPPTEYIDAATQGTVIHEVMELLYMGRSRRGSGVLEHPVAVTAQLIDSFFAHGGALIKKLIKKSLNRHYLHSPVADAPLTGDAALIAEGMYQVVKKFLEYDRSKTPFDIIGCEISGKTVDESGVIRWQVPGSHDLVINMKFSIDRVDRMVINGDEYIRIVDYKTGSAHHRSKTIDQIFESDLHGKDVAQILIYASIYRQIMADRGVDIPWSKMIGSIYNVINIKTNTVDIRVTENVPKNESGKSSGRFTLADIEESFFSRFCDHIRDILNPEMPFEPAAKSRCESCNYRRLCDR